MSIRPSIRFGFSIRGFTSRTKGDKIFRTEARQLARDLKMVVIIATEAITVITATTMATASSW